MLPEKLDIYIHGKPVAWDTVFLDIAFAIAQRSKDNSTQCGAVLVNSMNEILSVGFNGPPRQLEDEKVPWNLRPDKYAYIIHAEENALWYARNRIPLIQSKMYVTHHPCTDCILRLIRANIHEIIIPACHSEYPLSKLHKIKPSDLIDCQTFPKLQIKVVEYQPIPFTRIPL